MWHKAKLIS